MKEAVDSALGIAKEIAGPLYQDAVKPAAVEVGKAGNTIGRAINVVLAPLRLLVWGGEQLESFIQTRVAPKLAHIPPEQLVSPAPTIAVPVLQALTYAGSEPTLSEMYANLLAAAMDGARAREAHPAFVDAIKQLTPDDARVLKHLATNPGSGIALINIHRQKKEDRSYNVIKRNFSLVGEDAGCICPELVPTYLDNLVRLGLAEIRDDLHLSDEGPYKRLEDDPRVIAMKQELSTDAKFEPQIQKGMIRLTTLGRQFVSVCLPAGVP